MAPIRRYLRITKYSVLEVRIYLEDPSNTETWLLRRENPALPRIIAAVRPLVLPKLREENERARNNKQAKKRIKDVVHGDDFEASIHLTELSTRHSLLTKQKQFADKTPIRSNSSKLTKWLHTGTSEMPHEITDEGIDPIVIREEDADEEVSMSNIPEATTGVRRSARTRGEQTSLFVHESDDDDDDDFFQTQKEEPATEQDTVTDDKKKLAMNTIYDGYSIYGRILCLLVKRKGPALASIPRGPSSSQKMLENWVSTQANQDRGDEEDDDG